MTQQTSTTQQTAPTSPSLTDMTAAKWRSLTPAQRGAIRDNSGLSVHLIGLEGWRVEVVTDYGETRRFIVGKTTGWRPCHLEIARRTSSGGSPAEQHYQSVRRLYYTR